LAALQLGHINAKTLQERFGIPAVVFGIGQTIILALIYRVILKKEAADKSTALSS